MTGRKAKDTDQRPRRVAPTLTIDYALYDRYLEGSGMSEERKREFLDALWSVIVEFVMLGFEVHPAQAAQDACGKRAADSRTQPDFKRAAVQSSHSKTSNFSDAAGGRDREAAERIQE